MQSLAGMTRTVVVLIILRMIAAPVAMRPDAPTAASNHRFVVRVCTWPVPRPLRQASQLVLPGSAPDDRKTMTGQPPRPGLVDRLTRSRVTERTPVADSRRASVHLSDCPRC